MLETFKATAKKVPGGLKVETESRGFNIILDEPKSLGGSDQGMNPVEALLCALGACQTIVASAFARAQGFKFEEFHVELEGDLDTDGFLGKNPNVRKGFQEIRYNMFFKTEESQERTEAFVQFIERTCPVGDSLEHGVTLVLNSVNRY